MHELPMTKSIVEQACAAARANGLQKISGVRIVIGELSSIVGESVAMYFSILSEGTEAEGASLSVTRVGATLECASCGCRFTHEHTFDCPACGGESRLVKGTGIEFYIESIEAE